MRGLEVFGHLFDSCYPGVGSRETPLEVACDEGGRAEQCTELAGLTAPYRGVGCFAKIVVMVPV